MSGGCGQGLLTVVMDGRVVGELERLSSQRLRLLYGSGLLEGQTPFVP